MSISSSPEKPQLAFLGPLGTYSHQAALECFGDSVEYLARPTIADVQRTVSAVVPFGIIPQENSLNGSVVETYNILRIPEVGQGTFVRGATVFAVKHSLVVRRGVKLENIEKVLSHEQALGQCQGWLAEHLPRASLVRTDSTANAAKRLLSAETGLDPMKCAAICSSVVVTIYEGLEVLEQNIQDGTENFTRFYILSQGLDVGLPEGYPQSIECMALLRLQAPGDPVKPTLNIPRAISTLDLIVERIDRRPSVHGRPFDDIYFLEVGAIPGQNSPELSWRKQLQQAVDRVKRMGAEVSALGYW
ncbi:Prephenate dehydratase-domain-containing protein [Boletus edulis]|uniref:prephenate dehydratase n=1 Tax=Boletus edulis BED1 TaxID=1328754 RepID=A0AAD4C2G0_BOLED|nr:Prephenate dehydratase-domain-containing protein [Boletus edulis]KAF8446035.1 Prephenate dehydratase-domain-containing protein [Boletus edulis BED1]